MTKVDIVHVPYNLLGGQTSMAFATMPTVLRTCAREAAPARRARHHALTSAA
jgi:hypothetical protein